LFLPRVSLLQERLRLVAKRGVRGEETGTVERFECTAHGDEATQDEKPFCSLAMRTTELHADTRVRVADHTPHSTMPCLPLVMSVWRAL